ncbi:WecB/TagA/CpsF family glycosyltransferase [Phenylobacterium sp. Root700]|uniref:WecB/TagA/CpsF family glycosyltransferase n=1 Tax=Phenylobacterium sp. Root700 TaxID=1736591 RepID=UPI0006FB2BE2|nr:WecB/TagA/CpsF family glycosyltransferase [Phenylobacterium sp. Root700]KRB45288.1 glycosyl transferase [Phenylobacterium sp. Root700]
MEHSTAPQEERRQQARTPFRRRRRPTERVFTLGVHVDLVRPEEVMHHVVEAVASGERWRIGNHNAHSIYLSKINADFAAFFDAADLIEIDSTPLIFFTRILGLHTRPFHRCTYLDWREHFWSLANRNQWRIFYLGGAPDVAERAAESLRRRYPGVLISARNGYFDVSAGSNENTSVIDEVTAFQPQILFVGMGMPRQEIWIQQNIDLLPACVVFSVGAAFDYEAGVQCAAPRWMGRAGIEWLFRLVGDPRRLFFRYCIEPWFLLPACCADIARAIVDRRLLRSHEKTRTKIRRADAANLGAPPF